MNFLQNEPILYPNGAIVPLGLVNVKYIANVEKIAQVRKCEEEIIA